MPLGWGHLSRSLVKACIQTKIGARKKSREKGCALGHKRVGLQGVTRMAYSPRLWLMAIGW